MNSIEAMMCFAAFIAIIGMFAGIMDSLLEKAELSSDALASGIEAEGCASFIHSIYANTAAGISAGELRCFVKGSEVFGSNGRYSTELFISGVKINQAGNGMQIEVDVNAHYR